MKASNEGISGKPGLIERHPALSRYVLFRVKWSFPPRNESIYAPSLNSSLHMTNLKRTHIILHLCPLPLQTLLYALLAVTLLAGPSAGQTNPPHRRALLIGISNYATFHQQDMTPLFPDLNCNEDLTRIQAALTKTFQFDPNPAKGEIVVLKTPAQTTRQAILDALDRLAAETKSGDIVYIHYSGHGSRLPDATKPDGYETTIVPADYGNDQSNEITGRELGAELAKLKANHPGQIIFSFDCCHSGTATRGSAKMRGLSDAQYAAWYKKWHKGVAPPVSGVPHGPRTQLADSPMPDLQGPGCVILSACANDQSAFETTEDGKDMGRLSYVLAQVLSQAGPRTTYHQIYDQVRAQFTQKFIDQSPQLDGDPNSFLLGGTAREAPASIMVTVAAPGHYKLDAGSLQGMTVGSEFALYDKDASELSSSQLLTEAKITALDLTSADLSLIIGGKPSIKEGNLGLKAGKSDFFETRLSGGHAVELCHHYDSPPLTLDAGSVQRALPTLAGAILAKLTDPARGLKLVHTTLLPGEKPDILLTRAEDKARGTAELDLVRGDTGYVLGSLDETKDLPTQIYNALQTEARYRYAVGLGQNQAGLNRDYHIALRLVPAEVKRDGDGHIVFNRDQVFSNKVFNATHGPDNSVLHVGDYFTIEVQNTSATPLFFTILDLGSNGDISQPWPSPRDAAQTNILLPTDPGQWVKLWRGSDKTQPALYHATSADPHEIYKAIATDQYVSFKALRSRGTDRGPESPFNDLFGPSVDDGVRGTSDAEPVDPGSWTAATDLFQVMSL